MVKATVKPLDEIKQVLKAYDRVLNVGCGGCVSVCLVGGQREVQTLNHQLREVFKLEGVAKKIDGATVERQCNLQFVEELAAKIEKYDCIMSMACGAGVQLVAERFPQIPVFPAVNTMAIGVDRDVGVYEEKCRACGECVLAYTGGICPVTRCAKGLFNGPCGGVNGGHCEVDAETNCAWCDIFDRLKAQDRLADILKIRPTMQWQNQTQRTVIQPLYRERYVHD
jgi:ferredoxin